jgi:multidrug efflux system outer membrane protein
MHKLALVALLSACSLAPKYERPAAPVANRWDATEGCRSAAELGWRQVFGDARMAAIIDLALTNNRDLRIAALNVELVRAQYRIQRASLFPQLSAVADAELRGTKDDVTETYTLGGSRPTGSICSASSEHARRGDGGVSVVGGGASRRRSRLSGGRDAVPSCARSTSSSSREATLALVRESSEVTKRLLEQGNGPSRPADRRSSDRDGACRGRTVTRAARASDNLLVLLAGVPALLSCCRAAPLETTQLVSDLSAGVPPRSSSASRRVAAEHDLRRRMRTSASLALRFSFDL